MRNFDPRIKSVLNAPESRAIQRIKNAIIKLIRINNGNLSRERFFQHAHSARQRFDFVASCVERPRASEAAGDLLGALREGWRLEQLLQQVCDGRSLEVLAWN